jgi:divalent metal cation (Fe/Co/Zn/Cd) transporter
VLLAAYVAASRLAISWADITRKTALDSSAAGSESRQAKLCAHLSLLVSLLANAVADWWWADPIVALLIAAVALREARDA